MNEHDLPEDLFLAIADTLPPAPGAAPVELPNIGCIPLPPCDTCGEVFCGHLRDFPADTSAAPRVAVEAVFGPDGVYRGEIVLGEAR